MFKELYLALESRILQIPADDSPTNNHEDDTFIPLFKYVDLWNQNVEFAEEDSPFTTPAVFIEFLETNWRNQGNGVQDTDPTIIFHIVTQWFGQTSSITPEETRESRLLYLDLPKKLKKYLSNFKTEFSNGLIRTGSKPNHNHERYVDWPEVYTCMLTDNSSCVEKQKVKVGISID
jgi:hypothetical protein